MNLDILIQLKNSFLNCVWRPKCIFIYIINIFNIRQSALFFCRRNPYFYLSILYIYPSGSLSLLIYFKTNYLFCMSIHQFRISIYSISICAVHQSIPYNLSIFRISLYFAYIYLCIYILFYQFLLFSIYLSIPYIYLPIYLSIYFIHLSIYFSIPYVDLSIVVSLIIGEELFQ